jgi:predicted phage terminase large subunit-like protein
VTVAVAQGNKQGMALAADRVLRERARRYLIDFATYVAPWYEPAPHHVLLAKYLEKVETYIRTGGKEGIGRLLIFMPPRHGKTEMVSRLFPAWLLGRLPDSRVMLTSYGADLANKNSKAVRDYILGQRYQAVFGVNSSVDVPVMMSDDSRSVQSWELASPHRGGSVAAGVGGALVGMGAHLLVPDDLFKNRKEAENQGHRDVVWEWWRSAAYTRLEKGGAVVGMMTRWHPDDWAGRLLKAMANDPLADEYVVLSLPALAETPDKEDERSRVEFLQDGIWPPERDPLGREAGDPLWGDKYDRDALDQFRANVGLYEWAAQYQQRPYLRSGEFFKREWFQVVDSGPKPDDVRARVRYWDKAASGGGDYSVGVLMSVTRDGFYYVEHVARGRWTPGKRDAVMVETALMDKRRDGPRMTTWHQQDPGSAGKDSAEATNRKLAEAGVRARFEPVTGNKEVRADPWSSMCQAGKVRLVRSGWNSEFVEEHVAFPKGNYDDQVDAASSAFSELAKPVRESKIL